MDPKCRKVSWTEVTVGDVVYPDNYEGGLYPDVDPKVSGPFVVISPAARTLAHPKSPRNPQFMHYPENLIMGVGA